MPADTGKLQARLTKRVDGEVRFDAGTRGAYAHDGSNYRQPPTGVVLPRSADAAAETIAVCSELGVPLLSRGGGTSLAGQCCNEAVVIDWSKHCDRVLSVDPDARTAVVEPGIALDKVNDATRPYGLMVGPRPSTHVSCTIGGMIGNNACGSTAQAYGKMADSVIPRRVSGYNLDQLLPEKGFNVARSLVGSESTLVTVLAAEIDLVRVPQCRSLVVLGYPDIFTAAEIVPLINRHSPLAAEGLDDVLISLEHKEHLAGDALKELPEGSGWMMVQFGGDSEEEVRARAQALIDEARSDGSHPKPHVSYIGDPEMEDELWHLREASLGATAFPPGRHETHEGWEDAAVPPERLASYLRDFRALLERHGYPGASLYGHFGHGCVHTRIPFDLRTQDGIANYRAFAFEAADLVVSYGGSLSGEHGDGQSRGELLSKMFGPRVMQAFEAVKELFDPDNRMNPGKVVNPRRLDENLTLRGWFPREPATFFSYPEGCRKECPVDVDMGTYKAEFLAHHYAGRLRPMSHYSMGWLPVADWLATAAPGVASLINGATRAPVLSAALKRAGGIDPRRDIPAFAADGFTRWFAGRRRAGRRADGDGRRVIVWPDTFTNYASLRAGVPVVVLEPSCAAVFRSDAAELLGSDDARLLASRTRTLAEILTEADWPPGDLPTGPGRDRTRAIAQVHCHQHAILGFDADAALLRRCGVDVEVLDSGCCGLAGNLLHHLQDNGRHGENRW